MVPRRSLLLDLHRFRPTYLDILRALERCAATWHSLDYQQAQAADLWYHRGSYGFKEVTEFIQFRIGGRKSEVVESKEHGLRFGSNLPTCLSKTNVRLDVSEL